MTTSYSTKELMACVIARDLKDGEDLQVGFGLPVPEVATRLAHLNHGPNMNLIFLGAKMNIWENQNSPLPEFSWDNRVVRWSESYSDKGHRFDSIRKWSKRVFFISGLQIDQFGNTNLIGLKRENDLNRFELRGPGSIGVPTLTSHVGRYYIVANRHDTKTFVKKCDFISAFGWGDGGHDARTRLALPGGGPKFCITPLAVLDFEERSKAMRLHSVHPGVSLQQVLANTDFELVVPKCIKETKPPTQKEILTIRNKIDLKGSLRD